MNDLKYRCESCKFYTSNLKDYNRHIKTQKHINQCNNKNQNIFKCECGKEYKYRGSLFNHKKSCKFNISNIQQDISELKILF